MSDYFEGNDKSYHWPTPPHELTQVIFCYTLVNASWFGWSIFLEENNLDGGLASFPEIV